MTLTDRKLRLAFWQIGKEVLKQNFTTVDLLESLHSAMRGRPKTHGASRPSQPHRLSWIHQVRKTLGKIHTSMSTHLLIQKEI
jgi:hypothetical protein